MMDFKIIPDKDWETIRKYFGYAGVGRAVLIPETVFRNLPKSMKAKAKELSKTGTCDYNFGGEADIMMDVILSPSEYAAYELLANEG